nr:hypothetical protein [Tanacetum cinerariifolium]
MDLESAQNNAVAKLLLLKQENGNSFNPVHRITANADGTSISTISGSQYKDAKTLFEAIQARFGGNEATKKTQKTLLKQMYENFNALSTKSLDSIFNRLSPKSQESRSRNQDNSRKTVIVEDTSSKAMVAIDGAGFNWS